MLSTFFVLADREVSFRQQYTVLAWSICRKFVRPCVHCALVDAVLFVFRASRASWIAACWRWCALATRCSPTIRIRSRGTTGYSWCSTRSIPSKIRRPTGEACEEPATLPASPVLRAGEDAWIATLASTDPWTIGKGLCHDNDAPCRDACHPSHGGVLC